MTGCQTAGLAVLRTAGLAVLVVIEIACGATREASAQGVAFQPIIGTFPDGVMLNATPVVTADRRYVRFTNLQPQFTVLQEFNVFVIPGAVAGGGGFGGGGFGGGGFGGGGAGFGSVPVQVAGDPRMLGAVATPAECSEVVREGPRVRMNSTARGLVRARRGDRRAPQP